MVPQSAFGSITLSSVNVSASTGSPSCWSIKSVAASNARSCKNLSGQKDFTLRKGNSGAATQADLEKMQLALEQAAIEKKVDKQRQYKKEREEEEKIENMQRKHDDMRISKIKESHKKDAQKS